jgi:LysR family transcriptional activator of nhaA
LDIVLSTFPAVESETDVLYNHLLSESPLCLVEKRTSGSRSKASGDSALSFLGLLERERVYLPTAALESRAEFDYLIESKGVRLNIGGEVDDIALLRVIALTGKGVVLVPKMGIQHDLQNKSLSLIHEFRSIRQRFYAITRQKKFPNPMIESLVRSYS